MILGIGIDLAEVDRIEDSMARFGDRFLRRILGSDELAYCLAHARPGPHVAARFAAKEAVGKAFGTGIGFPLGWQDIEVCRLASGAPAIRLHGQGQILREARGVERIHLSLTHTLKLATAVVILEGREPSAP